jgi:hypothetical protein
VTGRRRSLPSRSRIVEPQVGQRTQRLEPWNAEQLVVDVVSRLRPSSAWARRGGYDELVCGDAAELLWKAKTFDLAVASRELPVRSDRRRIPDRGAARATADSDRAYLGTSATAGGQAALLPHMRCDLAGDHRFRA